MNEEKQREKKIGSMVNEEVLHYKKDIEIVDIHKGFCINIFLAWYHEWKLDYTTQV